MKRTIRFATPDDDLSAVFDMARLTATPVSVYDDFYAVLLFPEPYDIIILAGYQKSSGEDNPNV